MKGSLPEDLRAEARTRLGELHPWRFERSLEYEAADAIEALQARVVELEKAVDRAEAQISGGETACQGALIELQRYLRQDVGERNRLIRTIERVTT